MWKWIGIAVVVIVGVTIGGSMLGVFTSVVTAPGRVIQKTLETDNIIYNYEWFKRQYNDIIAIDKKLVNAKASVDSFVTSAGDRANWTFEDKQEDARLRSVVLGLENQRADMVSEYNAKATMLNRKIFMQGVPPEVQ